MNGKLMTIIPWRFMMIIIVVGLWKRDDEW